MSFWEARAILVQPPSCAVVESFFKSLKAERVKHRRYRTREAARADVGDYIERFYNRRRLHPYLDYVSPVEYELKTVA